YHLITASHASYVSVAVIRRFLASRRARIFAALGLRRPAPCDTTIAQKTQTSIRRRYKMAFVGVGASTVRYACSQSTPTLFGVPTGAIVKRPLVAAGGVRAPRSPSSCAQS